MFRYVSKNDEALYNGKEYDENINWNDPIILYDENDNLIYNPSTGVDKRNVDEDNNSNDSEEQNSVDSDYDASEDQNDKPTDEGDVGADNYDDFGNETIITDDAIE